MYERKRTTMKGLFPSALLSLLVMSTLAVDLTLADSASEIDRKATEVLKTLYDTTPGAKVLGAEAKGILIFPKIVKVGFLFGGQMGDGAMRKGGKTTGYYRSVSASFGLQAGVQAFDYVLMFMDDASLNYLERSSGWELGTGPSIVIADKGIAISATTTTIRKGVYAFIFGQQGVMAGIELQGSKITQITPEP